MKISGTLGSSGLDAVNVERAATQPGVGAPNTKIDDPVTFSAAAREREAAAAHPRFGSLSVAAHQNPELADQLAYDYGHMVQEPLYDARGWEDGSGPLRYSGTGEVVTPESEAHYEQLGNSLHAESLARYKAETAKGTDSADIFDKLIALGDEQSAEFRSILDWEGKLD
jgi:hypothetical protein